MITQSSRQNPNSSTLYFMYLDHYESNALHLSKSTVYFSMHLACHFHELKCSLTCIVILNSRHTKRLKDIMHYLQLCTTSPIHSSALRIDSSSLDNNLLIPHPYRIRKAGTIFWYIFHKHILIHLQRNTKFHNFNYCHTGLHQLLATFPWKIPDKVTKPQRATNQSNRHKILSKGSQASTECRELRPPIQILLKLPESTRGQSPNITVSDRLNNHRTLIKMTNFIPMETTSSADRQEWKLNHATEVAMGGIETELHWNRRRWSRSPCWLSSWTNTSPPCSVSDPSLTDNPNCKFLAFCEISSFSLRARLSGSKIAASAAWSEFWDWVSKGVAEKFSRYLL